MTPELLAHVMIAALGAGVLIGALHSLLGLEAKL
jgi:hypothetical protein